MPVRPAGPYCGLDRTTRGPFQRPRVPLAVVEGPPGRRSTASCCSSFSPKIATSQPTIEKSFSTTVHTPSKRPGREAPQRGPVRASTWTVVTTSAGPESGSECRAARKRLRWPSWRNPMVGTNARRRPPTRARATNARTAGMSRRTSMGRSVTRRVGVVFRRERAGPDLGGERPEGVGDIGSVAPQRAHLRQRVAGPGAGLWRRPPPAPEPSPGSWTGSSVRSGRRW